MHRFSSRAVVRPSCQRTALRRRQRILVEALETRTLLTAYVVANASDAGAGSLRQAILDANANAGADTIGFDTAGVFSSPQVITLTSASGQLAITDDVAITGTGASNLTINGGGVVRGFNIDNAAAILNVTLAEMTITNCNGVQGGGVVTAADGAAVRVTNEVLTLNGVVISGNTNSGANDGGGFATTSTAAVTIRNSTISGNTSGKNGGGVYFFSGGSLLMENSTVSGNTAPGAQGGGGMYFFGTTAVGGVVIRNSTFAGNSASGTGAAGGGIVFRSLSSTVNPVTIQNSTITGNSVGTTSTTVGLGGGGIAISSGTASSIVSLESTIISGNTAPAVNGRSDIAAIAAAITNFNFCAVGDADGFTPSGTSANNLPNGSALNLLGLANYGGPTKTVALGGGSLAVGAGSNPSSAANDQRGPGFPRLVGPQVDIGAFEGVLDIPGATGGPYASVTASGGTTYSFTVTYSGATAINVSTLGNNDVRVTGPGGYNQLAVFDSVDVNTNGTPRVATYHVTAPGGTFDVGDNGAYTIAVEAGSVANTNGGVIPATTLGTFQVGIPSTYIVSNTNDSGPGSFRQAILDSNATAGVTDTITFAGFFQPGSILLDPTVGQLNITDGVNIVGPGAGTLSVSGGDAVRVLNIENAASVINVSISGLTFTHGNGVSVITAAVTDGGAVRTTDENVTLDDVVISNSSVNSTNDGGGFNAVSTANVVIRNSTISGNTSGKNGGGIYFFSGGSLLLENSTVSGNTAAGANGGGGMYFFGTVAANGLTIRNSTIANNSATNSTATASGGGGLVLRTFTGTALIQDSTISGNSSASTNTTVGFGAGGIALSTGSATSILTLQNSIVSGNTSDPANGRDDVSSIAASTVNANFSAIGDSDGFTLSGTSGNNLPPGSSLTLGALANNGGSTQTMLPGVGSLLIGAGSNGLVPAGVTFDQRGAAFPRISGASVDIGSVEVSAGDTTPPTVESMTFDFDSVATPMNLQVDFSEDVQASLVLGTTLTLQNTTTATFVSPANMTLSYGAGDVAKITFQGLPGTVPSALPKGNYVLTATTGVHDTSNNALASPQTLSFFFINGDANHDRAVDSTDFNRLASNFGAVSGKKFSQGDFTFNGAVDSADFNVLASNFGTSVAPGAGARGGSGSNSNGSLFGDGRHIGDNSGDDSILA